MPLVGAADIFEDWLPRTPIDYTDEVGFIEAYVTPVQGDTRTFIVGWELVEFVYTGHLWLSNNETVCGARQAFREACVAMFTPFKARCNYCRLPTDNLEWCENCSRHLEGQSLSGFSPSPSSAASSTMSLLD